MHVRSAQEVLAELRRRRAAPRFADAAAVEAEVIAPLEAALAADARASASVARLGQRIAFVLHEPDAAFALEARGPRARVARDAAAADVTLALSAQAAERLLDGRLDVARALRSGDLRSDAPPGRTLAIASVLTALPRHPQAGVTRSR